MQQHPASMRWRPRRRNRGDAGGERGESVCMDPARGRARSEETREQDTEGVTKHNPGGAQDG